MSKRAAVTIAVCDNVEAVLRDAPAPMTVSMILTAAGLDYNRWYATAYTHLRRLNRLGMVEWYTPGQNAFFGRGAFFGFVPMEELPPLVVVDPVPRPDTD